jgi:hypothetical protein
MSLTPKLLQQGAAGSARPVYIEDVFSTYLYAGNGTTQTINNGIDLSGKGGLVWVACRSNAQGNYMTDTVRGATKQIAPFATAAQNTEVTGLTAFTSTGYTFGSKADWNFSGYTYVNWTFRKQPKFFDIVTYTGTGGARTINHNLGSAAGCIMIKCTSTTSNWMVWHRSISGQDNLYLNTTAAASEVGGDPISVNGWPSSTSTTTFNVDSAGTDSCNTVGETYVAYLFAHNAGGFGLTGNDNVISCGSYIGSNNPSYPDYGAGRTVTIGYEPQFVLIKNITLSGQQWLMLDNMRQFDNSSFGWIFPNSNGAEQSGTTDVYVSPTATGFRTYGNNSAVDGGTTSHTFIYIAIRKGPMRPTTDATKVFKTVSRSGNNNADTVSALGFTPDLVIAKNRTTTYAPGWFDRLRGPLRVLRSNGAASETSSSLSLIRFNQDGVSLEADAALATINFSGTYANWFFRRAPGFFDEVCYTGTGSPTTVAHNLAAVPELMFVKRREAVESGGVAGYWIVYASAIGNNKNLLLNTTDNSQGSSVWNNTTPTSSGFTVNNNYVNYSTETYVAYLFATCPGVSKVGSYTGNGSSQTINCGFAAGARFVLIKRTDSAGNWYVFDTVRGIVSGNDPWLILGSSDAEISSYDAIDPDNSGFIVNNDATNYPINVASATYIFLAIA